MALLMYKSFASLLILLLLSTTSIAQDLSQGITLFENGELPRAENFFSNYLKTDKQNPEANFYMGRIYFDWEEFGKATDWFKEAAKYDNTNSAYHMWLGHSYGRQAQNASVLRQAGLGRNCRINYEKAIELDPQNIEARESIIDFYIQAPGFMGGGREKAEAQADFISNIDGVAGVMAWGRIYNYYDETDNALNVYNTAVEMYPEAMAPYNSLYAYYFNTGDLERAKEITAKQLSANDTTSYIWVNSGNAYQWNGEYDAAILQYRKAIETDTAAYNAWYQIGRLAAVSGTHLEEGLEWIQKFIDLGDTFNYQTQAWAHFRKGTIFEHLNNEKGAAAEYQQALKLNPEHPEAGAALERLK